MRHWQRLKWRSSSFKIMDEIFSTILNETFTLTQLKLRLRILKSHLLNTFFGSDSPAEPLNQLDLDWQSSLPKTFYQHFNKDNVYDIFKDLESSLNQLQVLTIYLVFEGSDQISKELGTVARKTFNKPSLLLDIKYDSRLIAGCSLVWKGVYHDYSLISKIEGKKAEILQSFKKFLR